MITSKLEVKKLEELEQELDKYHDGELKLRLLFLLIRKTSLSSALTYGYRHHFLSEKNDIPGRLLNWDK